MPKQAALILIKFISLIPFFKTGLRIFYIYGMNNLKRFAKDQDDILDVIITSDTKSKDFNYGQSDYNLLIIVKNHSKPKQVLKIMRQKIRSNIITNLVFHTQYIPIITLNESRSEALKCFLMRSDENNITYWSSILKKKEFTTKLVLQNQYSALHSAFANLDLYLLRNLESKTIRSKIKNIYRSIWTLGNHYPKNFALKPKFIKKSLLLINYPFLSKFLFSSFLKESWSALKFDTEVKMVKMTKYVPLPSKIKEHLNELIKFEFISDITFTPSIIQNSSDMIRGKIFFEIHVNELVLKSKYLNQLKNLEDGIKSLESKKLKIRVRTITQSTYKLQLENGFYTFPLETHYRNQETISVNGFAHNYKIEDDCFIRCSTHFLVSQFMRFRSVDQKTSLIGSKFIKSLNLMFRYYQLDHYLKSGEFLNLRSETQIREVLTPQFSEIDINDVVTYEQWILIKAQLLYLLKQIRNQLLKYDSGLKDLTI